MKKLFALTLIFAVSHSLFSQDVMTPELLWKLGRVNPTGISEDGNSVVFAVTYFDAAQNNSSKKFFMVPVAGGESVEIENGELLVKDKHISPTGTHVIKVQDVKVEKVFGKDHYPEMTQSDAMIYDDLMYRHWDNWKDGEFSHVLVYERNAVKGTDIMEGEPYHCPQSPFGGDDDYTWSPDGEKIVYVAKKKNGKAYALSTNTDLYAYDIETGETSNLTEGMMGYDTHPAICI